MYGSLIVEKLLYAVLKEVPEIVSAVGDQIYPLNGAPQGASYPVLLFYQQTNTYDDPEVATTKEHITGEVLRYVVRLSIEGSSPVRIIEAAEAQLAALAGQIFDTEAGDQVTFVASGEFPTNSSIDGAQIYRHLGTIYSVTVTNGGS